MGIVEELQERKRKAEKDGVKDVKFLVNQKTYNALCMRGIDRTMLIISGAVKDGDCVMVKGNKRIQSLIFHPGKEITESAWEPIRKMPVRKATKKKRKYKKRRK